MASTLAKVRGALRYRLREGAAGNRAIATPELNEIIQANVRFLAGKVPLGEAWAAGAVTVTAASEVGTLATTVEYAGILEVRRTADGQTLTKCTPEELNKLFWQSGTATTRGTEEPTHYAILESAAQAVTLRFQNYAKTTTTLDIYRRVMPSDLTADSSAVPFAVLAVEALIDLSAVEAISKLPEKVLAERSLNPQVASFWSERAKNNIKSELERINSLRGVGRPLRFVP